MAQHCPECGFANDDGASYCQRCGAFLAQSEPPPGATTATYKLGETGELEAVDLGDVVAAGAALVIRAGGGRAGESFPVEGDRVSVGRLDSHRLADGDELQIGKYKLAFLSR